MIAWLISTLVPALADDALKAIFSLISGEMQKRNLIQQGMAAQGAKETATAEHTEAAMGQAIADAPQTDAAALDRLRKGTA